MDAKLQGCFCFFVLEPRILHFELEDGVLFIEFFCLLVQLPDLLGAHLDARHGRFVRCFGVHHRLDGRGVWWGGQIGHSSGQLYLTALRSARPSRTGRTGLQLSKPWPIGAASAESSGSLAFAGFDSQLGVRVFAADRHRSHRGLREYALKSWVTVPSVENPISRWSCGRFGRHKKAPSHRPEPHVDKGEPRKGPAETRIRGPGPRGRAASPARRPRDLGLWTQKKQARRGAPAPGAT